MNDRLKQRKADLINGAWLLLILGGGYGICKYLLPLLYPFIIGFAIALICKPLSFFLAKKLKLGKRVCGAMVIFSVYLMLLLLLWFLGGKLIFLVQNLATHAQEYYRVYLLPVLDRLEQSARAGTRLVSPAWAPQMSDILQGFSTGLQNTIAQLSSRALSFIAGIGMQIPRFLVQLLFAVMASIFISMDYQTVSQGIVKLFPKRRQKTLLKTKELLLDTAGKYLRAYGILMVITFFELAAGLFFLGVENSLAIAAMTAFCDALPVFGTGIILLPWAFIKLVMGNFSVALGILILYCIVGMVRSFLEPRILGKQLGLHPLATLLAVYLGFELFGVTGMIFFPVLIQILVQLRRADVQRS